MRSYRYSYSVFDSPNIASLQAGHSGFLASLGFLVSADPPVSTFHATFQLPMRYYYYHYYYLDIRLPCKIYLPKLKFDVFPCLKPSALLDPSCSLLALPPSQLLGLKTSATLLMPTPFL